MAKRLSVANVMEREMICSEHGALCYIEAVRRERQVKRLVKRGVPKPLAEAMAKGKFKGPYA